ncbi:HlyU family transcriptional regulator [Mesorhizobium sp. SP-1A]|uniref:HlyU family transcriptional regulator n=1 Tax=Mesorhizobium sp. SP-1A TaxID=3077840 RepID=UPI0028F701D3|nr:HlyU family transcriptional regulator [Mesorhizobium sp. SP-1A]
MSFLKRLFGGGSSEAAEAGASAPAKAAKQVEHKGFTIAATPYKEEGQYQTCGVVSKEIDGEVKEHRFVRADRFAGLDDAVEVSIRKGIQLVDEQGEQIFGG